MPELTGRIAKAETLIKAAAGLLALVPGIAILVGLVDIPPTLIDLIKYLSFAISIVVLLSIFLLSEQIKTIGKGAAATAIIACAVAGAILATSYLVFARNHVVVTGAGDDAEQHIIPLRESRELRSLIEPYAGDYVEALETSVQQVRLNQLMERESGGSIAVMITLLVLAQTLIITAIVLGAWKLTEKE
jgi:hypothetical protein